jgi:hypothetical protein
VQRALQAAVSGRNQGGPDIRREIGERRLKVNAAVRQAKANRSTQS